MLDFDYDSQSGESIAYWPASATSDNALYRVRMVQDIDPENPWEAWGCEPPLLVRYQRSLTAYGDIMPLADISDSFIARNWLALAACFDMESDCDAKAHKSDYKFSTIAAARRDMLETWQHDSAGNFETLETLCQLRGWPVLNTCSTGYSQGNYANILLCWTPQFNKQTGNNWLASKAGKAKATSSLRESAKLYGYWAWGDCYGYIIESRNLANLPSYATSDMASEWIANAPWEHVDSCYGFYGPPETSGLADAAMASLPDALA